jgi:hypothetical protein
MTRGFVFGQPSLNPLLWEARSRTFSQRGTDLFTDNPAFHVVLLRRADALVAEVVGDLASSQAGIIKAAPSGPRRYRPARAGPASGTHATGRRLHRGPQLKKKRVSSPDGQVSEMAKSCAAVASVCGQTASRQPPEGLSRCVKEAVKPVSGSKPGSASLDTT